MKLKSLLLIIAFFFISKSSKCQNNVYLLNDPNLQIEITDAINEMYNFKFEKSDPKFFELKKRYPTHPLPYFIIGLSTYWHILPNEDNKSYDDKFVSYMDSSIVFAERLLDKNNKNYEAIFFLAGAHAFKGRLLADRGRFTKAAFVGKSALKYLEKSRDYNDYSVEFLFGEGLYNFYAEWIRENYKSLRPILWFFPNGDKPKGITQLKECAQNAFYTRTESQVYLMHILSDEENKKDEALVYAKKLLAEFPDNSYVHRYVARILFALGRFGECDLVSKSLLERCDRKQQGYDEATARYATFYMAWINKSDKDKAKKYFNDCVKYSEKINATNKGYYFMSLEYLYKNADEEKNYPLALSYCQKIIDTDGNESFLKEAKAYKKANKNKK